jgi:aryl-alcohol dehydrogenase-like predicted oxidoreductase
LSRVSLTRALEASLRRLGVEVIDLYQAHAWDPLTPIQETLRLFDDAVRVGKIQYVGVSNFIGWQLQKTALLTRHLGLAPIVTLQPQYNLLQRGVEFELAQVCVNEHIGILPWSPLGAAGCRASTSATAQRPGRPGWARTPSVAWRRMRDATPRSAPGGSSTPSGRLPRRGACRWPGVALAWLVDRPAVTSVILGARTLEQLDDNLGAAGLHLSAEEIAGLDQASAPIVDDYPYGDLGVSQRNRGLPAPVAPPEFR